MEAQSELLSQVNVRILNLNDKLVEKFGPPPPPGVYPESKKSIFDFYMLYHENKPTINDFHDRVNIEFSSYIDRRLQHLVGAAEYNFGLSSKQFYAELEKYMGTGGIINDASMENKQLSNKLRDEYRETAAEYYEEIHGCKEHCAICGDADNLVKIKNADRILCKECMDLQKSTYGLKFSRIINKKNGKSYSYIINKAQ